MRDEALVPTARHISSIIIFLLIESGGFLGGTATKGLVGPFMTCYDAKGEKQIIKGLFSELVQCLIEENGGISPEDCRG